MEKATVKVISKELGYIIGIIEESAMCEIDGAVYNSIESIIKQSAESLDRDSMLEGVLEGGNERGNLDKEEALALIEEWLAPEK